MAKIIYGVLGEGFGHSSRSQIIIEHLQKKGHQVKIFASNKAYAYLSKHFEGVYNIHGLEFVFSGQKIDVFKTIQRNIQKTFLNGRQTFKTILDSVKKFKPDLAITDFEPFVPLISKLQRIPFISVNHQHLITNCELDFFKSWQKDFNQAWIVTNNMYWPASYYFITSFYFPKIKKKFSKNTKLVGPILRKQVLKQKTKTKNHVLVYTTTKESKKVLSIIKNLPQKFVAYGFGKKKDQKNIVFKQPSAKGFIKDLAESKAVITGGGYTLISEALFFGKPVYSLPINGQFEQLINAQYLEKSGYGLFDSDPKKERIEMFFRGLEYFKKNIERDKKNFCANKEFFNLLDKKIKTVINNQKSL